MLSESTKTELRDELSRLEGQTEQISRRMESIRQILESEPPSESLVSQMRRQRVGSSGLAEHVRRALAEIGRAATAKQIAQRILAAGFNKETKTPLQVAVGAELYRMANRSTGGVVKVRRGLYRISNEAA